MKKRRIYKQSYRILLGSLCLFLVACVTSPRLQEGPWDMISNDDAREKFIMVQQSAPGMSYKQLLYNMKLLSSMYPNEDIITITKAGVVGDFGQTLDPVAEKEHKKRALATLEPFIKKTYDSPIAHDRVIAYNHYYYHSGQFKKQYQLGHQVQQLGGRGGEVLVAIGGSMYALQLDEQGDSLRAKEVAQESLTAWDTMYDLSSPIMRKAAFENSYYISSLAISGQCDKAQNLFENNLKSSKRYRELSRWYEQFHPSNIKGCKTQLQISSQ